MLAKILGRSFIVLEALQTLVVEVEVVLNDRPLTYLSANVTDLEPLTPSQLLNGRRITMLPYTRTRYPTPPLHPVQNFMRRLRDRHNC